MCACVCVCVCSVQRYWSCSPRSYLPKELRKMRSSCLARMYQYVLCAACATCSVVGCCSYLLTNDYKDNALLIGQSGVLSHALWRTATSLDTATTSTNTHQSGTSSTLIDIVGKLQNDSDDDRDDIEPNNNKHNKHSKHSSKKQISSKDDDNDQDNANADDGDRSSRLPQRRRTNTDTKDALHWADNTEHYLSRAISLLRWSVATGLFVRNLCAVCCASGCVRYCFLLIDTCAIVLY
jgi:hypothetical protein